MKSLGCGVKGSGFRMDCLGFGVSGFGFRVSGFGFRVSEGEIAGKAAEHPHKCVFSV